MATRDNREFYIYVYDKIQTWTTSPSFPLTCALLFITSTPKLVASR